MQDYLFVNFSLDDEEGDETCRLLSDCGLLEAAIGNRSDREAWMSGGDRYISFRLPWNDDRLHALLDRLRSRGIDAFTRLDREFTDHELDRADWLVLRIATAGLYGGADYGQTYRLEAACQTCGAGAEPVSPLIAEIGKMGKKDIDHLVYEGHLIATSRVAKGLAHLTGIEPAAVRSPRLPPDARFAWLRIVSTFPRMDPSTRGYATEQPCTTCGRSGHFGTFLEAEAPVYDSIPSTASDFNLTFEYFGTWQETRSPKQTRPVGGSRGIIVSQRARKVLKHLRVRRLVWVPVATTVRAD